MIPTEYGIVMESDYLQITWEHRNEGVFTEDSWLPRCIYLIINHPLPLRPLRPLHPRRPRRPRHPLRPPRPLHPLHPQTLEDSKAREAVAPGLPPHGAGQLSGLCLVVDALKPRSLDSRHSRGDSYHDHRACSHPPLP